MVTWVGLLVFLSYICGAECLSRSDDALDSAVTGYEALGAVVLLIAMVAMLALCAGGSVNPGEPLPQWVYTVSPDPALDTGITGCSDGLNIINPNCVFRHRKGAFETDGAKWGAALSRGKHVFELYWPSGARGTTASVGVGSADAPLFVKPKDSLVGSNSYSWGLDIVRRRLIHKKQLLGTLPRTGMVPDKFYMYVDCDSCSVGYGTEASYYGAPLRFPREKLPVHAMIGIAQPNAQVTMLYRGSENRAAAAGQMNTVMVPSQGPGGTVHVTVVNPGTIAVSNDPPPPKY